MLVVLNCISLEELNFSTPSLWYKFIIDIISYNLFFLRMFRDKF